MGGGDCNTNQILDICELFDHDCNSNHTLDVCELALPDCNTNGTLDTCEPGFSDCNTNGTADSCERAGHDCNSNAILDVCELPGHDCNNNATLDICEPGFSDCNTNGTADSCELAIGAPDCNNNGTPDVCELAGRDCNSNGTPDLCELAGHDCDGDGTLDACDSSGCDRNHNGIPDDADIASRSSLDCNSDAIPDECQHLNTPGVFDGSASLRFNGAGQYVETPYSAANNPASFTVELWVKYTGALGSGNYYSPFASRFGGAELRGYLFYLTPADRWEFWTGGGGNEFWTILTGPTVQPGQWTHLAGTYDATTGVKHSSSTVRPSRPRPVSTTFPT